MFNKRSSILGIILGLVAILAIPASANTLQSATATANCQGYTLTAVAADLVKNKTYTIDYNFTLTCNGGAPVNVPGTITFTAAANTPPTTVTASGTFPGLAGSTCVVTGTAALMVENDKQIPIVINGGKSASLTCSLPTASCVAIVAEQGVPITPVTLTGSGGAGGPYTFSATGLPPGLSISTSGTISGTPTASGTYPYTVTIKDNAGNTGTINCSVTVTPPPSLTCAATNSGEVGAPFNSGAITVTGGTSPYTFSIVGTLPAGLTLNTSTGAITGTPTAAGTFSIQVTDSLGAVAQGTCPFTIIGGPQVTCAATGTSGEVGAAFNSPAITVTGGTSPYAFSVVGTLPAGLTLNTSTGAVTGTPTAAGSFSIQVKDANGVVGNATCPYTIIPGPQVTCLATGTSGEVGAAFSSGAITVTGGASPYTFSVVGTLSAGLTLNTSTGAITGTPTAAGNFSIQVKDANGVVGNATCPYTIIPGPQVTCLATGTSGEVGAAFSSVAITVSGGTAPYTFSVVGTLPAGLTLNTSTGAVTGTPTAAGTFSIQVTDADGVVGSATCPYTIIPGPQVTCLATGTSGEVGAAFSSGAITVSGGTAPYTFSIVGTLPAGLTLNTSTGAVTGTPTAAGTFSIQVKDANGVAGSATCPYTIIGAPQVTCLATGTSGEVGAAFSSGAIAVTGGTSPYTFSVVGTLPAGLTLNTSTGAITGTPSAPGTFSIQVTDANGVVGNATCPYTIIAGPQVTCAATATSGEVGVAFNSPAVAVTGGTSPYTFSVVGTLPAGLTLNTSTGAVTGTPTAAGSFSIQVKDANGVVGNATCPITIIAGPQVTCAATATSGEVGTVFSSPAVAVTGGTSPYTFSIVGTLPAGLTLNTSTGAVTGTPTASGSFTIQVKDANGVVGNATCPITIIAGPQVTCSATATSGEVGTAFNSPAVTVTGGTSPYTFSIIGTLPAGLTLNTSTGAVTGTPTAAGTFSIQVKDANGVVGNATCPITIIAGPQVTCSATATSGEVGTVFNSPAVAVTGGTSPYTFSIVGTLPAGLTLNTSTGAVTGTPTAAGTFSIQVKDANGVVGNATCPITIIAGPQVTCSATATSGEVGTAFNSPAVTVTGGTSPYTFSIIGTLPAGLTLNTSTGAVTGTPTAAGSFSIQVKDANGVVGNATCPITIIAGPQVTCAATATSGEVGTLFNSPAVAVTGGTSPYTFSIVGTLPAGLTLNTSTGAVTGTPTAAGTFSIQVKDANGVVGNATCPITIIAGPQVTCSATATSGEVGTVFNSPAVTVTGGTSPYTFSIIGTLPAGLTLNTSTGAVTGTPTAAGSFSIQVKDANGVLGNATCPITIIAGPQMTCAATATSGEVGTLFNSPAVAVTGGTSPYTFSIVGTLPAGLTLNTSTGAVTGTPTASGSFSIQVKDANGVVGNATCPITIIAGPQVTCSATATSGEVGTAFNSPAVTVTGGTSPYTFSIIGTLPAGLTLNTSTGAVTGTPTAAGTFSIQVKDANGVVGNATCPYTIIAGPQVTCSATATSGEVGTLFNSPAVAVTGGTSPYTFSIVGTLPAGLTLNTSTGAVTGTPTAAGTFSIQVKDANGVVGNATCPITIIAGPQVTCSATATSGEVGTVFNSPAVAVTGGTSPYTFSVVGTLPAGLTLNTSTGAVTGTPTAAGSFSIQVKDANGVVGNATCPITIIAGPQVTCAATATSGEVGTVFSSPAVAVTGGTSPYTFSIVGTLPAGLTLNTSTGAVTGTPTASGSFTIQVKDANGVVGNATCPITIIAGPQVTCSATATSGEVGTAFNSPAVTVTGGTSPYTFSIIGTLPAGLTLNTSTGAVTGTPTAAGTFSIQVKDANGVVGNATCPITIIAGPQVTCSATATSGEVGTLFNSPAVAVTGGTSPYTFSIVGTLPAGLTLNTSTGAVTGTPTAAGSFSIQVKDANGVVGNATCPITIVNVPQLTCSATNAGVVGAAFDSGAIPLTGGAAPYTYSVVGTLPAGLTLNTSTGEITGTATAPGNFSIQVTDANGAVSKGTCPFTISMPPCLTAQLGPAAGFSVLGLQGANVQLGGQLTLKGSVGIGAGGKIGVTSGDNFPGTLFADPTATVTIASGSGFAGGVTTESMSAIQSAALAEAASVGSLTPTQTLSQITVATTITGNGGQNVIMVNGSVNLSSGKNLTISGGANDTFIFNITGGFTLNSANIVLKGIAANQVLFYFPGSGSAIQTNNATMVGIFLAPNRNISIMGGTLTSEFISGGTISIASCGSNTTVNLLPVCSPEQMALTCPANSGIVGTPYSSELTATGGESPYTFSITGGNLPAGLTLNTSNGDITGTPTAANPYGFTAKVVDASGLSLDTTSSSCTVTVTTNPYVCTIPPSSSQCGGSGVKWNSFKAQGSTSVVWVNLHIGTPTGISTSAVTTIQFTNVVLTVGGKTYPLPDGFLTFNPAAPATPTTTFDSTYAPNGRWVTTVNPSHLSAQIFFDGQAIPVDSTIAAGGTASISFTTESTDNTMSFGWQWGAAAYSSWPGNNQANILPYQGNLNAGSPQSSQVQQAQISGPDDPSSGCHSSNNYTGQFSQTLYAACTASCTPTQITPYIQVDGQSWQQANTVTISGCSHNVNLGPQPISGGSWSWTGPKGYTSTSRQINNIPLVTGTNTFVATYTNPNGCQSQETFTITVK